MAGRPRIFESPEELLSLAERYFADRKDQGRPATITGLALALGCCRDTLGDYAKLPEYADTMAHIRARVAEEWEERLAGTAVTGTIFWLKNNAGWRDEQHVKEESKQQIDMKAELGIRPQMNREEWQALVDSAARTPKPGA